MDIAADVIGLLEHELEHHADNDTALRAALVLLYWDIDEDPLRAAEWLPDELDKPLFAELNHQLQIVTGDVAKAADGLLERARQTSQDGDRTTAIHLFERAAALRLYWLDDQDGAAAAVNAALEALAPREDDQEEEHLEGFDELLRTAALALAIGGAHEALVALVEEHPSPSWLARLAARCCWEQLGEPSRAHTIYSARGPAPEHDPLALEIALAAEDGQQQRALLEAELEKLALEETSGRCAERGRLLYQLAGIIGALGEDAQPLLNELRACRERDQETAALLAEQLELTLRRDLALRRRDLDALASCCEDLARLTTAPPLAAAYRARAWELRHHGASEDDAEPSDDALELARRSQEGIQPNTPEVSPDVTHEVDVDVEAFEIPKIASGDLTLLSATSEQEIREGEADKIDTNVVADEAMDEPPIAGVALPLATSLLDPAIEVELMRRGRWAELAEHYRERASREPERAADLLCRASVVAEASGPAIAQELIQETLSLIPDDGARPPFVADDLLRLLRDAGEPLRLAEAYRLLAEDDDSHRALYLAAAAMLEIATGNQRAAEQAAQATLEADDQSLPALCVLAALHREAGRIPQLRDALQKLVEVVRAPDSGSAWLRELATLAETPREARELLERARSVHSDDLATMVSLAALYELEERFAEAAELRETIAGKLPDREAQAAAYIQLAELYRDRLGEKEHAAAAYRATLERRPDHSAALEALCALYESLGQQEELLATLQRRLEITEDVAQQVQLRSELALAYERRGDPDQALEEIRRALAQVPGDAQSVDLVARLCNRHQRWRELDEILAQQPSTDVVLTARADVLEQLNETIALAEVRLELFQQAPSLPEQADRAYDLGRVYEQRETIEQAIEWYSRATNTVAGHRPALGALSRIHRAAGDIQSLVSVLEQQLRWVDAVGERSELLLEAASAHETLGDVAAAIAHYEEALAITPDDEQALDGLERLYGLTRPLELAQLLLRRAALDSEGRGARLLRAAELFAGEQRHEEATEAYRDALLAEMGDREIFTAAETYLYERQRWREVMEIYEILIEACEQGDLHAYRLADLYSRRGQVQLKQLGQPGEAAASFFSALKHDPKSESAIRALTSIFAQQQDWQGLIRAYEFRAALIPDNELFALESLRQAARLASSRLPPSTGDAQRLWEQISALDPTDDEALAALTAIYRDRRDDPRLADNLEARVALEVDEEHALEMGLELARLCEVGLEDAVRAARAYEGVRRLNEHHEETLQALARIYEATGQWERCIEALNGLVLLEADPDERSLLYFKCGSIAEARFHSDEQAIALYRRSLEESAGCLPALHGLRDIYLRGERWHDALETLESELKIWDGDREQAGVLARMGQVLLRRLDDTPRATRRFEQALKLDPECHPALVALFGLSYERGDRARALQLADRLSARMANEGDPDRRSRFYQRRGALLADSGDLPRAADSLVVALELAPGNLAALDGLIDLCRRAPSVYDFATTFRRLEQLYRGEGNKAAVAHVLIAAGTLAELGGDAESALALYGEAREHAPDDFEPVGAQTHLLVALRRCDEAIAELREYTRTVELEPNRIAALLRLGEIYAEVLGRPQEAVDAYEAVLSIDMRHREGVFRLAQELYGLGRMQQARQLIEQLLDPELHAGVAGEERARYQHYLGAIQLRLGQLGPAKASFRRALQHDNLCVEAALALSHQLALSGDRGAGVELLGHLVREVSAVRGPMATLELRRALASMLLGQGDLEAAISAYEGVLRDADHVEDRIMLAELFARRQGGLPRAIDELESVLSREPLAPQVFELLTTLYEATGEHDRTLQVLQVIELMGLASPSEKGRLVELRRAFPFVPRRSLDERSRRRLQFGLAETPIVERMWRAIRPALERIFPLSADPRRLSPLDQAEELDAAAAVQASLDLFGSDQLPLLATKLPAPVIPNDGSPAQLLIDRSLLARDVLEVRFGVGRALGLALSGHTLIARLTFDDRQLVVELLAGLLRPPAQRSDLAEEFIRRLDADGLSRIDELTLGYQQRLADDPRVAEEPVAWLAGVERSANAHGLLACDDIGVALRTIATLGGQDLAVGAQGEVAITAITDGPKLMQFFLSEAYTQLRRRLCS